MESEQAASKTSMKQILNSLNGEREFALLCDACPDQLIGTKNQQLDKSELFTYAGHSIESNF